MPIHQHNYLAVATALFILLSEVALHACMLQPLLFKVIADMLHQFLFANVEQLSN